MSMSSVCVVTNALRLNFFDVHSTKKDRKKNNKTPHSRAITIKIEGMMCSHCENTVTECIEKLGGRVIKISHAEGVAVFEAGEKFNLKKLERAIVKAGFKVNN